MASASDPAVHIKQDEGHAFERTLTWRGGFILALVIR